jgi:hypothetical protein
MSTVKDSMNITRTVEKCQDERMSYLHSYQIHDSIPDMVTTGITQGECLSYLTIFLIIESQTMQYSARLTQTAIRAAAN